MSPSRWGFRAQLLSTLALSVLFCPKPARAVDGGIQFHGMGAGGSSYSGSGSTQFSVSAPGGLAPGDLLVAGVYAGGFGGPLAQLSWDAGEWTLIDETTNTSQGYSSWWLYRIAGASEPINYSFGLTASAGAYGGILAYGGVDPTRPLRSHLGVNATGSPWVVSSTAVQPGDWVAFGLAIDASSGADSWSASGGATNRLSQAQLALFDLGPALGSQVGPLSATSTNTPGGSNGAIETLVLVPAAGNAGAPDAGLRVGCGCQSDGGAAPLLSVAALATLLLARPRRSSTGA